jgi:hypothetical protein
LYKLSDIKYYLHEDEQKTQQESNNLKATTTTTTVGTSLISLLVFFFVYLFFVTFLILSMWAVRKGNYKYKYFLLIMGFLQLEMSIKDDDILQSCVYFGREEGEPQTARAVDWSVHQIYKSAAVDIHINRAGQHRVR